DRPCGPERPEYHLGLVVAVDGRRRLGGDAPVLEVAQHQGAVALGRVAEAAAAGGLDDDDVTLPHHYVRRRRDGDRLVAAADQRRRGPRLQAAVETPGCGILAVAIAAEQHIVAGDLVDAADAEAAAVPAGAARVRDQLVGAQADEVVIHLDRLDRRVRRIREALRDDVGTVAVRAGAIAAGDALGEHLIAARAALA